MQAGQNKQNQKNIKNLKDALKSLTKLVGQISLKRISKVSKTKKSKNRISKKSQIDFRKMSKKAIYKKAKINFGKFYFNDALPMFKYLLSKKYKTSEVYYYLGEIWYHRQNYKDAIFYYKKSALLNAKATYMPRLMLHSALGFSRIGDATNASNFYSTLIDLYPKSKEATLARKYLKNKK